MKVLFILIMTTIASHSLSQVSNSTNTKFKYRCSGQLEVFGLAQIYSLNFELIAINGNRFKTTIQSGFSYLASKNSGGMMWPTSINELVSFNSHHIEIGIGITPLYFWNPDAYQNYGHDYFFTARCGYRYQKTDGRFIFRIGYTPHISFKTNKKYRNWAGISFGYAF